MNPWLILTLAIVGELVGTTALKLSAGFTRFLPSLFVVAGYGAAIWLLSQSIQRIPIGVSYAVWSGAGVAAAALIGVFFFRESLGWFQGVSIGLIIVGVVGSTSRANLTKMLLTEVNLVRSLKPFFLVVDLGFILYWTVTLLHLIPEAYLFKDYDDPILAAWNWSFLPLDLLISATGLTSLALLRRENRMWRSLALISLVLTSCSGLQALAFWTLRADFDLVWWLPNAFLLLYPLFFIPALLRPTPPATSP